jgi:hypothetical protein
VLFQYFAGQCNVALANLLAAADVAHHIGPAENHGLHPVKGTAGPFHELQENVYGIIAVFAAALPGRALGQHVMVHAAKIVLGMVQANGNAGTQQS